MTRPYAEVIGDPISQSKSPLIHNFWLGKLGIDAEYRACHVRPEELEDYFTRRRGDAEWLGCNITIPHKETAAALIGDRLPGCDDFGAINLVVRRPEGLFGANTDVEGVVGPLNSFHDSAFNFGPVSKRTIAVIGAGGAARAALFGLHQLSFEADFRILVRRPEQGQALAEQLGLHADIRSISGDALEGVDILVNASPLGMTGKPPLNLVLDRMVGETGQPLLFEMVYAPLATELVLAARMQGFAVIDGLDMLIAQAVGAFGHLFETPVPRGLIPQVRELLTR